MGERGYFIKLFQIKLYEKKAYAFIILDPERKAKETKKFLQFLLLIFYLKIKEKVAGKHTVEQMLLTLRKLKCKVFENQIIPAELTKNQRKIFEKTSVIVPNSLGI